MPFTVSAAPPGRESFEAIEARRQRIHLSVDRLCRRADISPSTYRSLLRAEARTPNFRTINRLKAAISEFEGEA